jgi:hypothetical protein
MGGAVSQPAVTPAPSGEPQEDKLREGPCAGVYQLLEKCQKDKKIARDARALSACVSETDLLISCIHKNPAYFHTKK